MLDKRLATWLVGRNASARDGALRGLLSALWSFLQHPTANLEDHLAGLEETIAGMEHRFEEEVGRAIRGQITGIQARLETVKKRVVEDLKYELRRVVLMLALMMGCAVLALIGMIFGLLAAWTDLKGFMGPVGASLVLAAVFFLASLAVFGLLRSILHRSQPPPATGRS